MDDALRGKSVAILATDFFEDTELTGPREALEEQGAHVTVIAPHTGSIKALRHIEPAGEVAVDVLLEEADAEEYDALVLPGGAINADHLRVDDRAQQLVRDFLESGRLVAAICHAPWLLVSAGRAQGRTMTSYHTLQDDIRNAGGIWVDEEVVEDGNLITSRNPDDLPAFNDTLIQRLSEQDSSEFASNSALDSEELL